MNFAHYYHVAKIPNIFIERATKIFFKLVTDMNNSAIQRKGHKIGKIS